ncbi:MAG TPA: transglycosylase family protein [Acidimicrobiia bacterium]|nr:transglycosylase family protein [Acidimicrobiia bacterium]
MPASDRSPIPRPRDGARRVATAVCSLLVALGAAGGLAGTLGAPPAAAQSKPSPDPLADADQTVARLRRQADAAGAQYFAELGRFATLDRQVADLEAQIPQLQQRARKLRAEVRRRAVAAYEQANGQLAALIDSADSLDLARRAKLLDRLNARDDDAVTELNASVADLSAQRDRLRGARQAEAAALEQVRRQGDAINATLTAAVERQRALHAAAAAAAATATTTTVAPPTTSRPARSNTPPAAPSAPPSAPATYTPTPGVHPHHDDPFLVCTRARESGGRYDAYNPAGPYLGAYQFLQATWNGAANHAGRLDLVGVPANAASQYDQDDVAWALYQWQGNAPWGGSC